MEIFDLSVSFVVWGAKLAHLYKYTFNHWCICTRVVEDIFSVHLCVCLSDTILAATCLIYKSKIRCHRILYDLFKICTVWPLLKMLCSKVLVSFAVHYCLPRSPADELSMGKEIASNGFLQLEDV